MKKLAPLFVAAFALSGCGFQPIYATADNAAAPATRQVEVEKIAAPENLEPYIAEALGARLGPEPGQSARYAMFLEAQESAERLAVQIDATVTRYNYRLSAKYRVVDRQTGESFRGVARAVTSYNIVTSQYSTLFAERAAVQKAARQLAEEIERDLLIRFTETPEERNAIDPEAYETELDPSEILIEPRRGGVVEPIVTEDEE